MAAGFIMVDAVSMREMIEQVQLYIYLKKGVMVKIEPPKTDKHLQLLGKAYDIAVANIGYSI